jgi:hypothetical protein
LGRIRSAWVSTHSVVVANSFGPRTRDPNPNGSLPCIHPGSRHIPLGCCQLCRGASGISFSSTETTQPSVTCHGFRVDENNITRYTVETCAEETSEAAIPTSRNSGSAVRYRLRANSTAQEHDEQLGIIWKIRPRLLCSIFPAVIQVKGSSLPARDPSSTLLDIKMLG